MAIHIIYIVTYLVVQWPEFSVNLPSLGNFSICPSFFKKFDYSDAMVWFPFTVFISHRLLFISYYFFSMISYIVGKLHIRIYDVFCIMFRLD